MQGEYAPQGSHGPDFSTSSVAVSGTSSSTGGSALDSAMSKLSISPAVPSSSKAVKLPPRPGLGRSGNKCMVMTNHFMVSLKNSDMEVFHYDVCSSYIFF